MFFRLFLIVLLTLSSSVTAKAPMETEWQIRSAKGLDVLLLLGAASGEGLPAEHYPEEIAWIRERLSDKALYGLSRADSVLHTELGGQTGPVLALLFSTAPFDTLSDVLDTAEDPETTIRPAFKASPYWQHGRYWERYVDAVAYVHPALEELSETDFESWYEETIEPTVLEGVEKLKTYLTSYDVIPEQSRLLGRSLDPRIEVYVTYFSRPFGIRIIGQRFITIEACINSEHLRNSAVHKEGVLWTRLWRAKNRSKHWSASV
jgi:hypothetical protein